MRITRTKIILLISFIFIAFSINAQGNKVKDMENIVVIVAANNREFEAELINGTTSQYLLGKLPFTIEMRDLHNNEKFFYFQDKFPTNTESIGNIKAGDLMLYGDDCLVLFYESFSTTYRYTRIGSIVDAQGLIDALGPGSVKITFRKK